MALPFSPSGRPDWISPIVLNCQPPIRPATRPVVLPPIALARSERQIDERRDDQPVPPLIALEIAVRLGVVVGEEVDLRPRASSACS